MTEQLQDLAILGGGVGGLVVSSVAGQLGLKVTLVEKADRLGGDCLHYGCVPSKTLIHTAKVASLMRRGSELGLASVTPEVDIAQVNRRVRAVIERIQAHDDPERFRGYGVDVRFGAAHFDDARTLALDGERIRAKRFVIATGSGPVVPGIAGLEEAGFVTNETVFSLPALPSHLVVLGAGAVGLEMAHAFRRLGSRVTLIEAQARILPTIDEDVAEALTAVLREDGIDVRTDTSAERVSGRGEEKTVHCSAGADVTCDTLLVAVGRQPNVAGLGLERAGVESTRKGITVDARLRTSNPKVFACGDVTGAMPFTHVAEYQAGIVLSNAVFRFPKKADYAAVPWVIFTDPELAHVGQTERQARAAGNDADAVRFDFKDVDRALTEAQEAGFVKLVLRKGRIVGATALGAHAGELIHELALAVKQRAKVNALSDLVHAYPTRAQINRRAANAYLAPRLYSDKTRKVVHWINRLIP